MTLRANAKLVAMLLASPLVAAPPTWASSGGASPGGASAGAPPADASASSPSSSGGALAPSTGTATASVATATGDGITVTSSVSALLGRQLAFTGTAPATGPGATVIVQRLDPKAGWVSVASGVAGGGGAFSILWRTNYAGRITVRTSIARAADASIARAADASIAAQAATTGQAAATLPTLEITVYRPAVATFYGKGFFGQKTACGQTLRRATLGVASRTLKCGTLVQIYYGGRTIVVPVIDRGPFANHARWDLTQATAAALGITGTEIIGAVRG